MEKDQGNGEKRVKITRSSKCSLKFSNKSKLSTLREVMQEYGRVTNIFIDKFWEHTPDKGKLLKEVIECGDTWLTARLRKVSAREAIDMIQAVKSKKKGKKVKPVHKGKKMSVSCTIAELQSSEKSKEFDAWLHLQSIGRKIVIDLPVRFHKQYNDLSVRGTRLNSYVITESYVMFSFEIETGIKKTEGNIVGIDTGINALASTSDNKQYGTDIKECVERIKRCKHGSRGQQRARRALKQRIDEVSKEVVGNHTRLIVVEKLKNLNKNSRVKRRLTKSIRRSIGSWTYRYWLEKLQRTSEDRRSSFRSVSPYNTSICCSSCGFTDRSNRSREVFLCQRCGYADNADINAAKNILDRFLTGPYGASFKPKESLEFLVT